jgi:sugar/nucleoside kinase (ribokinase family)
MKKYDVLAIGELNVDMILTGLKSMPVLGSEIIADTFAVVLGSSTAICASGIARLGLKTGFISKIGSDRFGDVVMESLEKNSIDVSNVIIDKNINTGVTIALNKDKDRALVTYMGSIEELRFEDIDIELVKTARHIHIGSYFLQNKLRPDISKLFAIAKEYGVTTSLDAGWDDTLNWNYGICETLKNTDIFFPNEGEALNITKEENVENAVDILANYAKTVVVKCGPKGAIGKSGDIIIKQGTFDLKPIDTTGAGDSFNAGFIYGYLNGFSLEKCITYGNACGSISVTRIGGATSCATLQEVEYLISK